MQAARRRPRIRAAPGRRRRTSPPSSADHEDGQEARAGSAGRRAHGRADRAGRTRMFVEDVLKLGDGAVVELDKLAGDPVDVYVNDRKVAKGEVLVLNDNFCVRINEIVDLSEGERSPRGRRGDGSFQGRRRARRRARTRSCGGRPARALAGAIIWALSTPSMAEALGPRPSPRGPRNPRLPRRRRRRHRPGPPEDTSPSPIGRPASTAGRAGRWVRRPT